MGKSETAPGSEIWERSSATPLQAHKNTLSSLSLDLREQARYPGPKPFKHLDVQRKTGHGWGLLEMDESEIGALLDRMGHAGPRTQDQQVAFCRAADGTRLATAVLGKGPPLVCAPRWVSHIEFELQDPVHAAWLRELSRHHTFIRYDHRGCGLSDRSPSSYSFETWMSDFETVVDELGLKRFALFGLGGGGALMITYAVRHPDRVSHLVLLGCYAQGRLRRPHTREQYEEAELLIKMVRKGWGRSAPSYRQLFTTLFAPDATPEQHRSFTELERLSSSGESAAALIEATYTIDITAIAEQLRTPTLIFHARNDAWASFEEGRNLASLIPSARFFPLESNNHILMDTDPVWPRFISEFHAFLATPTVQDRIAAAGLTVSELEVLALVAKGLNNGAIASALEKSEKTVRNQVSMVFAKLGVETRAEAVVRAHQAGLTDFPVRT